MKQRNSQRKTIIKFIKQLNEQDFASANKSLEALLFEKIKQRIRKVATKPLF